MLKPEIKKELIEEFRRIRENKLLVTGISIGIVGGLIAGIINDLIKGSSFYPWGYLLVLILLLIIFIFKLLEPYFNWRVYQHRAKKWIKRYKKAMTVVREHEKIYGPIKSKK